MQAAKPPDFPDVHSDGERDASVRTDRNRRERRTRGAIEAHGADRRTREVAIIIFENANVLDIAGPVEAFSTASELSASTGGPRAYTITILSTTPGMVKTSSGVLVAAESLAEHAAHDFNTVLVVGGHGSAQAVRDESLVAWLRREAPCAERLGSVCTGAFVLAAAGLLENRRIVTHWNQIDRFRHDYPNVRIEPDSIYCNDGNVWTSAGVTAGLDMALALVERDLGHEMAVRVARRLVFYLRRPGGQSQFSVDDDQLRAMSQTLRRAVDFVVSEPCADLSVPALASRAAVSRRTLIRLFRSELDTTPSDFVLRHRVERAKTLLEQSDDSLSLVAKRSGFPSESAMRRAFQRQVSVTPYAYRNRFH